MATDIVTPSNTLAKVRWHEQYVSEGINKKFNGIAPHGVIRGGRLGTSLVNMVVVVEADPDAGDSIYSVIDSFGHQVTFRQVGDVSLNLTPFASTTVYIGLEITYVVSADTVVKWRAFSQAEVDADDSIVVLGSVDVPAAGLIPESSIYYDRRRDAGWNLSAGMRDWHQVIVNPSFEGRNVTIDDTEEFRDFPYWEIKNFGGEGRWRVLTPGSLPVSNPHTGDNNLSALGTGGGAHQMTATPLVFPRVTPGQAVKASVWVNGYVVTLGSGAGASVGMVFLLYDWDGNLVSTLQFVEDGTVITGTFDWFEISATFKVPLTVASFACYLYVNDPTSFNGDIGFDDFQVWLEPGPVHLPYDRKTNVIGPEVVTPGIIVTPTHGQVGDLDPLGIAQRALRLMCENAVSGSLEHRWGMVNNAIASWLMSFGKGRLQLGDDLLAAATALEARITTPFPEYTTAEYTLVWHAKNSGSECDIRVYVSDDALQPLPSVVVTHNAYWDGSLWHPDNTGRDSIRRDIGCYRNIIYRRLSGTGNWIDNGWDDGGTNSSVLHETSLGDLTSLYGTQAMADGRISFFDTVAGSYVHSNPDYDESPIGNAIYSKNIVKAWLKFGWLLDTPLNFDGFNLELVSVGQYLDFVFGTAIYNDDYSVIFSSSKPAGTAWNNFYIQSQLTTGFSAALLRLDEVGPAITEVDFDTVSGQGYVVVLGRQDT